MATAGQAEIDIRFDSLVSTADKMMMYKYIVKNVARRHGKTVTFMPKPIFGDNGSGMHTHQSIWKEGKPLFAGKEYAGVSQMCLHYIGGILKHAPALAAFTNPDDELLQAAHAGIRSAGDAGLFEPEPVRRHPDSDVFAESEGEADRGAVPRSGRQSLPGLLPPCSWPGWTASRTRSIRANRLRRICTIWRPRKRRRSGRCRAAWMKRCSNLEKDHEFLLKGGVFTEDLIEPWIGYKRSKEVDPMRLRPHPYEFFLYYDV